jgi:sensor c-di-GMP phosphodiesterase-like protein
LLKLIEIEQEYRRVGSMLFATRCSARYLGCVTGAISVATVYSMGRPMFNVYMAISGLVGGLLGFLGSLVDCRNGTLEQQLLRAIRRDGLMLVYQPVVDLANRQIVGAEALVRWTDERGLAVPPDVLIRRAEERGFVGEITRLAVGHVLRDLGALLCSDPGFHVSVNVTAFDLAETGFEPMLEAALAQVGVRSESMTIEITESPTARHERTIKTIRQLRAAGHRVHIDDFGTGYSSLAYLQDLAVDGIKIDKVFTQAIGTNSVSVGIVPQILAMAEVLHLEIVVEGIETEEQARYFVPADKPIRAQGWLFGKPVPAGEFLEMLAKERENDCASVGEVCTLS